MSASHILSSVVLAPFITLLSAVSLATLQRALEWVSGTAKTPQKGLLRQLKPIIKNIDTIFERILGGTKITVNTTNILLMAIVVSILVLVLTMREDKVKSKKDSAGKAKSH
eukprot:gene1526-2941_t